MSIKTCKQHTKEPVFIYAACAGCEIQRYREQEKVLKAENESLRESNEELRKLLAMARLRVSPTDPLRLRINATLFTAALNSFPENPSL